ncbi:MAG: family 10 glycosylhydrolase [Candidatus Sumerlaeia bacterium]|nr:family 10 glycosylhydrolase [Candidatus Sumerlaeia bacterium]
MTTARGKLGLVAAVGVAGMLVTAPAVAQQAAPEMRAVWISRFEWPSSSRTTAQTRIRTMMQTLRDNNFNAVLFQVRGQCDVLYPSPYEPWGTQFNWTNPGWDPLQYAIDQARANGIEFHAYINTHTLAAGTPPTNTVPQHPFHRHGPTSADPWVIHDTNGNPVGATDSYFWLSPGHPDASAWTRQAIVHVVENYDIDGLHFDRIRTPGAGYSYDPRTVARFNGDGNPHGESWGDFMRSQITRDLRRIYGAVALRKPHVKITAAPFGICRREPGGYQGTGTQSYYSWYQDSFGWMEKRVLDGIFPMIYWDIGSAHPFEVLLADFLKYTGGRHIYAGSVTSRDYIAQVYETRRQGAPGTTVFSYNSVDFAAYRNGPYTQPAPVPRMPWKDNPTRAIVAGTIRDGDNQPILDAWVTITGNSYVHLSGADGFYTVLDIVPGTYQVTARKNGLGESTRTVHLGPGDVKELDFRVSSFLPGDVDGNNAITPTDAQAAFHCYITGACPDGLDERAADVCPPDGITPKDALAIFGLAIGLGLECE